MGRGFLDGERKRSRKRRKGGQPTATGWLDGEAVVKTGWRRPRAVKARGGEKERSSGGLEITLPQMPGESRGPGLPVSL